MNQLVVAAGVCLEGAGYSRLPSPIAIGGIPFRDLIVYTGPVGSIDLILLVEDAGAEQRRLVVTVERVARALDVAGSRRPLCAIICSSQGLDREFIDDMSRTCRVIVVDESAPASDLLASILPLSFAGPLGQRQERELDLAGELKVGPHRADLAHLIDLSRRDAGAVRIGYIEWLDGSFSGGGEL